MKYAVYNKLTGEILHFGSTSASLEALSFGDQAGLELADDEDPSSAMVDLSTKSLVPRAPCPAVLDKQQIAADGVDAFTITNIPNPADVLVSGPVKQRLSVTDGVLTVTADVAGIYRINIVAFPYLDFDAVVTMS